jgi:outer membrane protein assembly factor BamB
MIDAQTGDSTRPNNLRLWPGVAAAVLLCILRFGVPIVAPQEAIYGFIGSFVCTLVIFIWWFFFSRAAWRERLSVLLFIAVGLGGTWAFLHESIVGGMMGRMYPVLSVPMISVALVAWAVAARRLTGVTRFATLAAAIVASCAAWTLVRSEGVMGEGSPQLAWRWTKTHEERLVAREPIPAPAVPAAAAKEEAKKPVTPQEARAALIATSVPIARRDVAPAEWPGFRGPGRDSVVRGSRIKTDWAATPPVKLWRREVGPGWSSFAVGGGLIYTQEQRGEFEVVACYRLATGEPVWTHRDAARFYESNGGPGPRGTPTLHDGRIYTIGATGILNALDASSGAVLWTRNAAVDTGAKIPGWGYTSSPLLVDGSVIVATSGRMAAYDVTTGNPRWTAQSGGGSYSSPHLVTIDGVPQIVLLNGSGATSVAPGDGKVMWKHAWPGSTILQPAMTEDGGLLITTGDMAGGQGTRRLAVAKGASGWTAEERWTTRGLKPYFNDLVVHKGHAFGFDGSILSCIDLKDGNRKWKGGRYGLGQMLLLADQDLLLVVSEEGELALVGAGSEQFSEVSRFRAIEGKTWNHPVLVGDTLLVRNGEEMVALRLAQ